MSTDTPTPPPAPEPRSLRGFWSKYRAAIMPLLTALLAAVVGSVLTYLGAPPKIVETVTEVIKVVEAPNPDATDYTPTTGWVPDENLIATNLDPAITLQFADTPAGRAVLGDDDVFLWRQVRQAAGKPPADSWYPNINQGSVGSCVGAGWKHGCDVLQATSILSGRAAEWKPVSAEVIYAGSRVEVAGNRLSGDGSNGSWAAKWVRDYGMVPMEKYGAADLTAYSAARARSWGRTGVPADLEALAKQHPVKGTALVRSWPDVKRAIQQGYPVPICSNQGFAMQRDATGRARPQGSWAHCMLCCGVRAEADGRSEGGFILNSWGNSAHTGPVWPPDAPVAGFWADAAVIDRMVRQSDSFAMSDVQGFPARKLDWLIRAPAPRRDPRDQFARFIRPEVSLAW